MLPASYLGLFCLCLLLSASNAALEVIELIHNGDFENAHELWREQVGGWQRRDSKEAAVSDQYYHSIRFSLRTSNGTIWQIIPMQPCSDLKLSFWLYLQSVPTFPKGRTIAGVDLWSIRGTNRKAISYYLTGQQRYQRENVVDIYIPDMQRDKWNYVLINVEEDFENSYPEIDLNQIEMFNLTVWAYQSPEPMAYWDDFSLTCRRETLKRTPGETASPPQTLSTASSIAPTQQTTVPPTQPTMDQWPLLVLGLVAVIVIAAIFVLRKKTGTGG